jgi:hypothetical protein
MHINKDIATFNPPSEAKTRKTYSTPAVIEYGDIQRLTMGAMNMGTDGGNSGNPNSTHV